MLPTIRGNTQPVEIFHTQELEPDYISAAIRIVLMIHRAQREGDILVFMAGEDDVELIYGAIGTVVENIRTRDQDEIGPLVCALLYSSFIHHNGRFLIHHLPDTSHAILWVAKS